MTIPDRTKQLIRILGIGPFPRNLRMGPEDRICIEFATTLRALTLEGHVQAIWFHVPNESKRTRMAGFLMRAMGLIVGCPDYVFMSGHSPAAALEFKAENNRQTESQEIFQHWCGTQSVHYAVVRSVAEALDRLKTWKILD